MFNAATDDHQQRQHQERNTTAKDILIVSLDGEQPNHRQQQAQAIP